MTRVCNWNRTHDEDLILGEAEPLADKGLTHGLCIGCQLVLLRESGATKEEIRELMGKRKQGRRLEDGTES